MLSKDNVEKIARVLINTKRWEVMLRAVGDDYGAMRSRNMISGIFRVFGCLDLGLMFSFAINDILLEFETKFNGVKEIDSHNTSDYVQRIIKVFAPRD
ncbi:MAG: hypothetical protein IJD43_05060 [Thermoguttaceae bacterium]|nr:hypothetical protein [Thermoguttaceae bacterium]